jgi:tetratricopeptide (TPR) repeat protein
VRRAKAAALGRVSRAALALAVGVAAVRCEGHRAQPSLAPDPAFAAADSLRQEGRSALALERFQALRDTFAARGDSARLWRAQLGTADALMRLGRRDSASAALEVALALAGDDPAREGRTRHVRSILLDRQGLFDSALVEATRALELAQAAGDGELEGSAYNAIGRIHSLSGRYREALAANERELAVRLATPGAERHGLQRARHRLPAPRAPRRRRRVLWRGARSRAPRGHSAGSGARAEQPRERPHPDG